MSPAVKSVLGRVATWPKQDQEELADVARETEARRTGVYGLQAHVLSNGGDDIGFRPSFLLEAQVEDGIGTAAAGVVRLPCGRRIR